MICEVCFEHPAKYWFGKCVGLELEHEKDLCQECKDRILGEIEASGESEEYDFETLY